MAERQDRISEVKEDPNGRAGYGPLNFWAV
jgi:hypothetical protein